MAGRRKERVQGKCAKGKRRGMGKTRNYRKKMRQREKRRGKKYRRRSGDKVKK